MHTDQCAGWHPPDGWVFHCLNRGRKTESGYTICVVRRALKQPPLFGHILLGRKRAPPRVPEALKKSIGLWQKTVRYESVPGTYVIPPSSLTLIGLELGNPDVSSRWDGVVSIWLIVNDCSQTTRKLSCKEMSKLWSRYMAAGRHRCLGGVVVVTNDDNDAGDKIAGTRILSCESRWRLP